MNLTILPPFLNKLLCALYPLTLEKKKSEFKPVKLLLNFLKVYIVSHPTCAVAVLIE